VEADPRVVELRLVEESSAALAIKLRRRAGNAADAARKAQVESVRRTSFVQARMKVQLGRSRSEHPRSRSPTLVPWVEYHPPDVVSNFCQPRYLGTARYKLLEMSLRTSVNSGTRVALMRRHLPDVLSSYCRALHEGRRIRRAGHGARMGVPVGARVRPAAISLGR